MKRALALVVLALAAAPVAVAQHAEHAPVSGEIPVSIGFDAVKPDHVDAVIGDTVTWSNDSVRTHTVTADDGSFDSGRVFSGEKFSHHFDTAGTFAYHCVLHPFIRGSVGVGPIVLATPQQPAASARVYPLAGRSALPPGTALTIEADHGSGFVQVGVATVAPDGSFVARIVPKGTATYRAVAGTAVSPTVQLLVLDRRISLDARRGRGHLLLSTKVTPGTARAPVVLQLFLPEHFGWWPVERARLDARSTARFALRLHRRVNARVVLTLPDGATLLAVSRTLRVGPRR
jgi:plastocyanin